MPRRRADVRCSRSRPPGAARAALGAAGRRAVARAAAWAQAAGDAGLIAPSVCLLTPETTAGPFYLDPGLVRADITEGRAGGAARAGAAGGRRRLPAARGGAGRRLALRRRRQLLGLRAAGQRPGARHPRRHLPARHPVRRRARGGGLRDDLAGLVPRADAARALPGVPRRADAADQPAVLSRRRQRGGVPRPRLPRAGRGAGHDQRHRRHRAARRAAAPTPG